MDLESLRKLLDQWSGLIVVVTTLLGGLIGAVTQILKLSRWHGRGMNLRLSWL